MTTWSSLQVAIFDEVKSLSQRDSGALVVEAGPGSGKTTTAVEALRVIPVGQRVVFVSFNKHTAEQLKLRVPANVEACTVNSFGWRAVRSAFRGCKMDDWKTRNAMRDFVADPDARRRWDGAMRRLISLKKATLRCVGGKMSTTPADELAAKYDLDLPTDPAFMQAAGDVWKHVINQTGIIDFDDQWFMPVYKRLPVPQADWVFVDEAQDLCSAQVELLKLIAPRIVVIGDPRQSIYGFRGANPDAMKEMEVDLQAKVLPLSICYRCPSLVVDLVNKIHPDHPIQSAPGAIMGIIDDVPLTQLRHEASSGSWVLCRTTAPLVAECLKFIVAGVKATVKGRDIGQQIKALIDKVGGSEIIEFTERLEEYYKNESKRLIAAERDAQLQALEDRVESIHALAEGARTVQDIYDRIDNVFSDTQSSGVTFATAHRSKGLEADDIYILVMPFPKAKTPWAMLQEKNLQFVAYTRTMKRLRFVRSK